MRAQDDVAEAARQERARKSEQQQNLRHVYTDEDLKREKILVPEDQARADARKMKNSTPALQNAEVLPVNPDVQASESLGEVARRYRQEKAAREEEAARKNFAPFPYTVPNPTLAAPKPEIAPPRTLPKFTMRESPSRLLVIPGGSPRAPLGRPRVSPFQPRPLNAIPPTIHVAPANPQPLTRVERPAIPHAAPSVEVAGTRSVEVQRGDSWWKLAARYLGDGARWKELRGLNGPANEATDVLRLGSVVHVLEGATVRKVTKPHIIVKKGDTLWTLARQHLGHASAWGCLASANPGISDYTRLAIGFELILPSGEQLAGCKTHSHPLPE